MEHKNFLKMASYNLNGWLYTFLGSLNAQFWTTSSASVVTFLSTVAMAFQPIEDGVIGGACR